MRLLLGVMLVLALASLAASPLPQAGAAPGTQQMAGMQHEMMAQMAAADDQLAALRTELNAATTTEAKVAAMTKIVNALLDERSAMRAHMSDMHKTMEGTAPTPQHQH